MARAVIKKYPFMKNPINGSIGPFLTQIVCFQSHIITVLKNRFREIRRGHKSSIRKVGSTATMVPNRKKIKQEMLEVH